MKVDLKMRGVLFASLLIPARFCYCCCRWEEEEEEEEEKLALRWVSRSTLDWISEVWTKLEKKNREVLVRVMLSSRNKRQYNHSRLCRLSVHRWTQAGSH